MKLNSAQLIRFLIIIVLGNILYFLAMPHLPPAARHERFKLDLGTLVDFWFCLVVFGAFELIRYLLRRRKSG
jgi:hypothetical protein